jgi:hypothetical protein
MSVGEDALLHACSLQLSSCLSVLLLRSQDLKCAVLGLKYDSVGTEV